MNFLSLSAADEAVEHEDAIPERSASQEKSPPTRQVSPDKALRAALLRGRFADLIVKAQEKPVSVNKVGYALTLLVDYHFRLGQARRSG